MLQQRMTAVLARSQDDLPKVASDKTPRQLDAEALHTRWACALAKCEAEIERRGKRMRAGGFAAWSRNVEKQAEAHRRLARARRLLLKAGDEIRAAGAAASRERRAAIASAALGRRVDHIQAKAPAMMARWRTERKAERKAIKAKTDHLKRRLEPKVPKVKAGLIVTTLRGMFVEVDVDSDRKRKTAPPMVLDEVRRDADGWRMDPPAIINRQRQEPPKLWAPQYVRGSLAAAFRVLDRTPMNIWPRGKGASWISYIYESGDLIAQASSGTLNKGELLRPRGGFSIDEIRACNEALTWQMKYLWHDNDAARAVGLDALWEARERHATEELDYLEQPLSERSFFRWKERGYNTIAAGLNRDGVPAF